MMREQPLSQIADPQPTRSRPGLQRRPCCHLEVLSLPPVYVYDAHKARLERGRRRACQRAIGRASLVRAHLVDPVRKAGRDIELVALLGGRRWHAARREHAPQLRYRQMARGHLLPARTLPAAVRSLHLRRCKRPYEELRWRRRRRLWRGRCCGSGLRCQLLLGVEAFGRLMRQLDLVGCHDRGGGRGWRWRRRRSLMDGRRSGGGRGGRELLRRCRGCGAVGAQRLERDALAAQKHRSLPRRLLGR